MGNFNYYRNANNPLLTALSRRNVFISYHHADRQWAQALVDQFGRGPQRVFNPKALALNYEHDRIESANTDYVMDQIRERYIVDSSVQIVMIGTCTHSRRYIEWEIKRSLSSGNGLLGILVPPYVANQVVLPERFALNYRTGYATLQIFPQNAGNLRDWIAAAFLGRTARAALCRNPQETWFNNRQCSVCRITH